MITDEMIAYEFSESREDRKWDRWVAEVEATLGHDLDGDEEMDGYSFDGAYDAFKAGRLPRYYVLGVRSARKRLGLK